MSVRSTDSNLSDISERTLAIAEMGLKSLSNEQNFDAQTLHEYLGDEESFQLLEHAPFTPEVLNEIYEGETALTRAAQLGKTNCISLLVDKGADINLPNEKKETPATIAYFNKNKEMLKVLYEKGADLYAKVLEFQYNNKQYNNSSIIDHIVISENKTIKEYLKALGVKFATAMGNLPQGVAIKKPHLATQTRVNQLKGTVAPLVQGSQPKPQPKPTSNLASSEIKPLAKPTKNLLKPVLKPQPSPPFTEEEKTLLKRPLPETPAVTQVQAPEQPIQVESTESVKWVKETMLFLAEEIIYGGLAFAGLQLAFPDACEIKLDIEDPFFLQAGGYTLTALVIYLTSRAVFKEMSPGLLKFGSQNLAALGLITSLHTIKMTTSFPTIYAAKLLTKGAGDSLVYGMGWLKNKVWSDSNAPAPIAQDAPQAPPPLPPRTQ